MERRAEGGVIALILAALLLDGGGPVLGVPMPWPTTVPRPAPSEDMRTLLVAPNPTLTPSARKMFPLVPQGVWLIRPTRTATPTLPPTRTATPDRVAVYPEREDGRDGLRNAVKTPGALVDIGPNPTTEAEQGGVVFSRNVWQLREVLQLAQGVELRGRGKAELRGRGVYVFKANDVTIRGLTIREPNGDGISVNRSSGTLVEDVVIQGPVGDGGIDIVHMPPSGGSHTLRRVTIRDVTKGMLLGHQQDPNDHGLRVLLEDVVFEDVAVRVPKVHRATVTIRRGTVWRWRGPRLDVQLNGLVNMSDTTWNAGVDSLPGFFLPTGGVVTETNGRYVPLWSGVR